MPATFSKRQAYSKLLDGFAEAYRKTQCEQREAASIQKDSLGRLIDGFKTKLKELWKRRKTTADDFNLLAVFDLESDEICHSKALAWLLNPDPRAKGTHYQGNAGFHAFLEEFGLDLTCADQTYTVETEPAEDESRLDIRMVARGRWLIGIEVKIWAVEGDEQTHREWRDLRKKAKREQVPENCIHAFFLTPDGAEPKCKDFQPITWRRVAKVFRRFSENISPDEVALFARHCARAMEHFSPPPEEAEEE